MSGAAGTRHRQAGPGGGAGAGCNDVPSCRQRACVPGSARIGRGPTRHHAALPDVADAPARPPSPPAAPSTSLPTAPAPASCPCCCPRPRTWAGALPGPARAWWTGSAAAAAAAAGISAGLAFAPTPSSHHPPTHRCSSTTRDDWARINAQFTGGLVDQVRGSGRRANGGVGGLAYGSACPAAFRMMLGRRRRAAGLAPLTWVRAAPGPPGEPQMRSNLARIMGTADWKVGVGWVGGGCLGVLRRSGTLPDCRRAQLPVVNTRNASSDRNPLPPLVASAWPTTWRSRCWAPRPTAAPTPPAWRACTTSCT